MRPLVKRCAIYTRKSTEEGLEQEFNSLDAQREACMAYIVSQKSEGWIHANALYDDGGYSGGTLQRPALKQLIDDIEQKKIDIVVVYKIDRLTRSLIDFAKLVDVFDANNVTFVSVTQAFSTTTSMGRLTLNVLLSFAQFEREVIGERIRDKIAASKKKGIWMGGRVPLGYRAKDRSLVVDEQAADTIRFLYKAYLATGSIIKLRQYLSDADIKLVTNNTVSHQADVSLFSRRRLYEILTNPIYIGKVRHKGIIHQGQHPPVIDMNLWDQVQATLVAKAVNPRNSRYVKIDLSLKGKVFDQNGHRYIASYTTKNGRRYHYYKRANVLAENDGIIGTLPASAFEKLVVKMTEKMVIEPNNLQEILGAGPSRFDGSWLAQNRHRVTVQLLIQSALEKIVIYNSKLALHFDWLQLSAAIADQLQIEQPLPNCKIYIYEGPFASRKAHTGTLVLQPQINETADNPFDKSPAELKKWIRSVAWREEFFDGVRIASIAKREKLDARYVGRLIEASLNIL